METMKRQLAIWGAVLAVLGAMPTARCESSAEGGTVLPPPPARPNARQRRYGTKLEVHGAPNVPAPVPRKEDLPAGLDDSVRDRPSAGLTRSPERPAGSPPPEAPRRTASDDKAAAKSWLMMSVDEILAGPGEKEAHQTISWGWLADGLRAAEEDQKPDGEKDPWGQEETDDLPASVFTQPYDALYGSDSSARAAPGLATRDSSPGVSGEERTMDRRDAFSKPLLLQEKDRLSNVTRDVFQRDQEAPATEAPAVEPEKASEGLAAHSAPGDTFSPALGGEAGSLPSLSGQAQPSILSVPAGSASSLAGPSGSLTDSARSAWGLPSTPGARTGAPAGALPSSFSALPGSLGADRRGVDSSGVGGGANSGFSSGSGALGRPLFSSGSEFGNRIDSTFAKPFDPIRPPAQRSSTESPSRTNLIKTSFPEAKSPLGW